MEVVNKPSWIITILGMVLIGTAGYSYGQQLELVNFWHAGESRAQKRSNGEFTWHVLHKQAIQRYPASDGDNYSTKNLPSSWRIWWYQYLMNMINHGTLRYPWVASRGNRNLRAATEEQPKRTPVSRHGGSQKERWSCWWSVRLSMIILPNPFLVFRKRISLNRKLSFLGS